VSNFRVKADIFFMEFQDLFPERGDFLNTGKW
jgi:hypothetical protein